MQHGSFCFLVVFILIVFALVFFVISRNFLYFHTGVIISPALYFHTSLFISPFLYLLYCTVAHCIALYFVFYSIVFIPFFFLFYCFSCISVHFCGDKKKIPLVGLIKIYLLILCYLITIDKPL